SDTNGVAGISWDVAKWHHVGHHEVSGAGVSQATHERGGARRGGGDARGAVVIAQIVAAAPDDIERIRIDDVRCEIVVHLFTHVVDGNNDVAERGGNGGFVMGAV